MCISALEFAPTFVVSPSAVGKQMGLPQPANLSIGGAIQTPKCCSTSHLKTKPELRLMWITVIEPTIKGATFNEEAILLPVEKLNNFPELAVLAHQLTILPLS